MQHFGEALGGDRDARARNDEFVADEQVNPLVLHRRHRGQHVPNEALGVQPIGPKGRAVAQLDDHLRRARKDRLRAELDRLPFQIGENVGSPRNFQQVVQKPVAATGIDAAQRPGLASEDEECSWTGPSGDTRSDRRQVPLESRRRGLCGRRRADTDAERSHRFRDVGQAAMHVAEDRDSGAFELDLQLRLRVIDDDEVGLKRKNPLDAWIQQPADSREPPDFRRKSIVAAESAR
jgi:hypothetical protein